jgi:hypothetical protein
MIVKIKPDSRGLDPAIQIVIEMFRFFLDGRVKHGHDEGGIWPRFGVFKRSKTGMAAKS